MYRQNTNVLVLGAGVIGLSTSLRLVRAGYKVTVWAEHRKAITSYKAGAFWWPSESATEHSEELIQLSKETFSFLNALSSDKNTGIICHKVLGLSMIKQPLPSWHNAIPGFRLANQQELKAGYHFGQVIEQTPVIIPEMFMLWLESEIGKRKITIIEHKANSINEALAECSLVINCTGIGASTLCHDQGVRPMSGQLLQVITKNKLDTVLFIDEPGTEKTHIIPYTDGKVILGGTRFLDDWNTEPDYNISAKILQRCTTLEPKLVGAQIIGSTRALRPWRSALRLATETLDKGTIIHNYGHGGSGYSLFWGCANEVLKLVEQHKS